MLDARGVCVLCMGSVERKVYEIYIIYLGTRSYVQIRKFPYLRRAIQWHLNLYLAALCNLSIAVNV
jgi:hypothetical protein